MSKLRKDREGTAAIQKYQSSPPREPVVGQWVVGKIWENEVESNKKKKFQLTWKLPDLFNIFKTSGHYKNFKLSGPFFFGTFPL
jgi:hypothetical protein